MFVAFTGASGLFDNAFNKIACAATGDRNGYCHVEVGCHTTVGFLRDVHREVEVHMTRDANNVLAWRMGNTLGDLLDAYPLSTPDREKVCLAFHAFYGQPLGVRVLTPHCDDRQMSSDLLVNLSLVCDCTMTYTNEKFPEKRVDVYLPRRSLQIQSGSTRYDYMHSIANENLHGSRRVSVTFRESGVLKKP